MMIKQEWFYYLQVRGGAVAKVNSDALDEAMKNAGFDRCTYREYLERRKLIREREQVIKVKGMVKDDGR